MEGRKENKYNLSGICPGCGKLLKVELVVATELVETGTSKKAEGKDDDGGQTTKAVPDGNAESAGVRPADTKGPAGTKDSADKSDDPGKGRGNKKARGKQQ